MCSALTVSLARRVLTGEYLFATDVRKAGPLRKRWQAVLARLEQTPIEFLFYNDGGGETCGVVATLSVINTTEKHTKIIFFFFKEKIGFVFGYGL